MCEFSDLSHLLASLPDPSLSQGQVEAVPITVAREQGVEPEASNETLKRSASPKRNENVISEVNMKMKMLYQK
jgi:hypothetical protein